MDMTMTTAIIEHKTERTVTEVIEVPEHPQRKGESAEFHTSVARLKEDGHYHCWVCDSIEDLQCHHTFLEWSLSPDADYDKLKALAEKWDSYGYGRLLSHVPMTSVDDIRNCLVLCRKHHEESYNGIHNVTMPAWVSQLTTLEGHCPVPQDHSEIEKLLDVKVKSTQPTQVSVSVKESVTTTTESA